MSINLAHYLILDSVMCETFVCKSFNFFAPDFFSYERWKSKQPTICWPVFEDTLVLSQWQKLIFMDANGFQDLTWEASLCHYQSSNGHIHTK